MRPRSKARGRVSDDRREYLVEQNGIICVRYPLEEARRNKRLLAAIRRNRWELPI